MGSFARAHPIPITPLTPRTPQSVRLSPRVCVVGENEAAPPSATAMCPVVVVHRCTGCASLVANRPACTTAPLLIRNP